MGLSLFSAFEFPPPLLSRVAHQSPPVGLRGGSECGAWLSQSRPLGGCPEVVELWGEFLSHRRESQSTDTQPYQIWGFFVPHT